MRERLPIQVGERIGRRVVVCSMEPDLLGRTRWFCRCDCGNELVTATYALNEIRHGRRGGRCIKCSKPGRPRKQS